MSEAVTVPSLMTMTSIVSEESLARDRHRHRHRHRHTHTRTHTHTHTDTHTHIYIHTQKRDSSKLKFSKSLKQF